VPVARAAAGPGGLRGTPGLCDWADEFREWWCWPTAKSRVPETVTVIERLDRVVAAVGERLHHQGLPVIAGYSNGGYLVSMLMADARVVASGFVVMHGGPITGVAYERQRERPTLLMAAAADAIQRPAMEGLKAKLDSVGWRSSMVVRAGGHPPEVEDYQRLFEFASHVSRRP
jgi:predicted esterase